MMTEHELLAMRAEILQDRAALPALLPEPENGNLLQTLTANFDAQLGIIDVSLQWNEHHHNPSC